MAWILPAGKINSPDCVVIHRLIDRDWRVQYGRILNALALKEEGQLLQIYGELHPIAETELICDGIKLTKAQHYTIAIK